MCIIIAKDAGVDAINNDYFSRAWDANSHGGGLVWRAPGEPVMIQKGFMNKQEFMDKLAEVNKKDNSFIAHFRIKSVGEIKAENCHPFVMDYVTFAHNGTLSIEPLPGKTDSETFGLAFLKDKPMSWIKEYQTLLEMALGSSKFAIMDNDTGEIFILNKDRGEVRDGAWFSNQSAFEPKTPTYPLRDWSNYWEQDYKKTKYMADRTLGTKRYKPEYQVYSQEKHSWVYSSSKITTTNYRFGDSIVENEKGMFELSPDIVPADDLPSHDYLPKDPIHKVIIMCQAALNKELGDYYKQSFMSYLDREDAQDLVRAMHCVLNAVRRLVAAKKEVSSETLNEFLEKNIKSLRPGDTKQGFVVYVSWQCEAFMEDYKAALK